MPLRSRDRLSEPSLNGQQKTFDATKRLHERGLWVVPIGADKRCHLTGWQHTRRKLAELRKMLSNDHGCHLSIAVVLNQSPFIDLECDSSEAEAALQKLFGHRLPHTPTWQSARGKHRLFMRPNGGPDKAKLVVDGIEFRGLSTTKGALSVVPPSGGRAWLPGLSLEDVEPAELPLTVAERLRSHRAQRPQENTQNLTGGDIREGARNDTIFKLAGNLLRAKIDPADVRVSLHAVNLVRCKPPLSESEVESLFHSVSKDSKKPRSHAETLMALALHSCELWKTPDDKPFATINRDGHKEHWSLRGSTFKQWLSREFFKAEGSVIGSQTLNDVVNTLEGHAKFDGPTHSVFLRIAGDEERIFIDLCNDAWQVLEVSKAGWRVLNDCPVPFRRTKGMLPLPMPVRGGSINTLRDYVKVSNDGWFLLIGWLLSALRPASTYPILKLVGEQGATKSTLSKVARSFVDPCTDSLLEPPRNREDLMTLANNYWLLAFDNLSFINQELSDSFCRLSTGGSMGKRRLYTDDEVTTLSATRPVLFNGIEDPGTRSDLMDRCVNLELLAINENERKSDTEFWAGFEKVRPLIFGSLLDLLSLALRRLPEIRAKKKAWPRMADFAQFAEAAEPALDPRPGYNFRIAYKNSQAASNRVALETTPITPRLLFVLEAMGGEINMTATDLHTNLCDGQDTRQKGWPKTPRVLSGLLGRMAPNLRGIGYRVSQYEKSKGDGTKNKEKFWLIVDPKRSPQRPQDRSQNLAGVEPQEPDIPESPEDIPEPTEQDFSPCDFGTCTEG